MRNPAQLHPRRRWTVDSRSQTIRLASRMTLKTTDIASRSLPGASSPTRRRGSSSKLSETPSGPPPGALVTRRYCPTMAYPEVLRLVVLLAARAGLDDSGLEAGVREVAGSCATRLGPDAVL